MYYTIRNCKDTGIRKIEFESSFIKPNKNFIFENKNVHNLVLKYLLS